MTAIVALDTETTGVHPKRQVWEVGMIRRDDEGQREIQFYVEVDLKDADPFGLSIGRFYERHPLGRSLAGTGPRAPLDLTSSWHAASTVAAWTHGAHIVGAVPDFDTEVLGRMLRAQGIIPAWHYHLVDVENLAVGYLNGHQDYGTYPPPWDSKILSELLDVPYPNEQERRTALGDAKWALRLYDRVMNPP